MIGINVFKQIYRRCKDEQIIEQKKQIVDEIADKLKAS